MEANSLPHSLESERIILSNLLCDTTGETFHTCFKLKIHHFFSRSHSLIFEAMQSLSIQGKGIDVVTVNDFLAASGTLEEVGGHVFLNKLLTSYLTSAHSQDHINTIIEKYQLRKLINISEQAKFSASRQDLLADDCIKSLEQELLVLTSETGGHENQLEEAYVEVKSMIETRASGGDSTGLLSGIRSFDDIFFGFQKSQYYVISGRPSSGKTAFVDQIAGNLLMQDKCVLYISLESDRARVLSKIACKLAEIPFWNFKRNRLKPGQLSEIQKFNEILRKKPLILLRPFDISPVDIRPTIRRFQRKQELDLIILDYIQKINIPSGWDERRTVSRASSEIQRTTIETGIPALVLAQLNREAEGFTRPSMRHLKESGQIEQDADNIGLLWSNVDKRDLPEGDMDHPCFLTIEKNKDGASGLDQEMIFEQDVMKFRKRL